MDGRNDVAGRGAVGGLGRRRSYGEARAMASRGPAMSPASSGEGSVAAAATAGLEAALWASSSWSACLAIVASSGYAVKSVMAARTTDGRRLSQMARRTSMGAEEPAGVGGRRARARSSVRAAEGRWSPSGCCRRSKMVRTLCSGETENFVRRCDLRVEYSTWSSPWSSSHWEICGKRASGRAARTRSAWVLAFLTDFSRN